MGLENVADNRANKTFFPIKPYILHQAEFSLLLIIFLLLLLQVRLQNEGFLTVLIAGEM